MEKGTDINDLLTSVETEDVTVEFADKTWTFTVRDITWAQEGTIQSKAMSVEIKNKKPVAKFNPHMYNHEYLKATVVNGPIVMNEANLLRLDKDFGDMLVKAIINRNKEEDVEDVKN